MSLPRFALEQIRVLDFSWVLAGPVVGHLFGDFGAEVIKIESRSRLEAHRRHRPLPLPQAEDEEARTEIMPFFHILNRNKLGVTVNLKHPKGIQLIKDLVRVSDVVIENFAPGTMRKLGIDYEVLSKINPGLVMASLSGSGSYGPYTEMGAYAPIMSSMAGFESLVGYEGEDPIGMISLNLGDVIMAQATFLGTLAALLYRSESGRGQHVDVSGIESMVSCLAEPVMDYVMNKRVAKPMGNFHACGAPYGIYRCKDDDQWISIAAVTEDEWQRLVQVMGNPSWAQDEIFASRFSRVNHRNKLDVLIEKWTQENPKDLIERMLVNAGVPTGIVANIADHFADPHLRAREIYSEVEHPIVGAEIVYSNPIKLTETPSEIRKAAPLLGEDNKYVFGEILGLTDSEINSLEEEKVIF
jgi:benzylsuccinate CoA-transferase BbsF subunit